MKDLVDFNLAKLAKEKGFNEQTYSDCWVETLDGDIIHNRERQDKAEHDRCEQYLMQPTLTSLQDWLREKHNININIRHRTFNQMFVFDITGSYQEGDRGIIHTGLGKKFDSYKKTLIFGLEEGLKLVKNAI